jgi:5-formyltetrahydrofolate cyclo-ligase
MDEHERHLRQRAKNLMRRRFRGQRSAMPRRALAKRSRAIAERLLADPALEAASAVALFWPIEDNAEVDLRWLDGELRRRGVALAYPAIDQERVMTFRRVQDPTELAACELGFDAPPSSAPELERLDVIVVPGLAFDARGYRIGYGGGFYDQALPRYRPPARAIGVAFDFSLAAEIPNAAHDVAVDRIVTDTRTLDASHPPDDDVARG